MNSKTMIGFANKFYTLWNVWDETLWVGDAYGKYHPAGVRTHYNYIKNISTSLEKVREFYPDLEIDESLRGLSGSFIIDPPKAKLPEEYFSVGKYYGMLIDEVVETDFTYALWAMDNLYGASDRIKAHPKVVEHFAEIERSKNAEIAALPPINPGDKIKITFESNGYNPSFTDGGKIDWVEAREYSNDGKQDTCLISGQYMGEKVVVRITAGIKHVNGMYPYIMPVINGKAQRVKGKELEVEVKSIEGRYKETSRYWNGWVRVITIK
jgi:hypothetical protein